MSLISRWAPCAVVAALALVGCNGDADDDFGTPPDGTTPTSPGGPTPTGPGPTTPPPACSNDLDGDGYVSDQCQGGDDCDDSDASAHPDAAEGAVSDQPPILQGDSVDNDCDGTVDEGTNLYDDDDDGYTELEGDCDDRAPAVNPGAVELCDTVDNDCNGLADDRDVDQDGYVDVGCPGGDDCADLRNDIHPGAPEGVDTNGDGIPEGDSDDNDCDGIVDEDTYAYDDDGDGVSEAQGDCDDGDALIYPGAIERFDDKDQNCDNDLTWVTTALGAPAAAVEYLPGAWAGYALAATGDVDGDGLDDLLIGAPHHDLEGGRDGGAFLLSGRRSGWGANMNLDDSPEFTFQGVEDTRGAEAGFAVAGAGDIDGDFIPDFAIGAPGYTHANNSLAGAVFVFPGRGVAWEDQALGAQTEYGGANSYGLAANVQFGYSLAGRPWVGACDVTADGRNDLIIGGPWNQATPGVQARGYLMVFPGDVGQLPSEIGAGRLTSFQGQNGNALGFAVGCGGDINREDELGLFPGDLLVGGKGTSTNVGTAIMVPGSGDYGGGGIKLLPSDAVSWNGDNAEAWVGHSVDGLGDINQDGFDDYAIGRRGASTGTALAYVVYGSVAGGEGGSPEGTGTLRITGETTDPCPCVLKGIGDFNDDGLPDMALGAAGSQGAGGETSAGRIFIFLGRVGGPGGAGTSISTSTADFMFTGEGEGDRFGTAVAPAGDLNGDGIDDFVAGAPRHDADLGAGALEEAGKVYIFFGFPI